MRLTTSFVAIALVALIGMSEGMKVSNSVQETSTSKEIGQEIRDQYDAFIVEYRREDISDEEYEMRLAIFADNLKRIEEHNADPNKTYTMEINQFSDMTEEEKAQFVGEKSNAQKYGNTMAQLVGKLKKKYYKQVLAHSKHGHKNE